MKKGKCYAQVVFPLPLSRSFDYLVPPDLQEKLIVGARLRVPFGKGSKIGYLLALSEKSVLPPKAIKPISDVIDELPLLDARSLELAKKLHSYYLCSLGEALEAILPTSLRPRKKGFLPPSEPVVSREPFPPLREEYQDAFTKVTESLRSKKPRAFLLMEGGSDDKTEFMLHLIQAYLEKNFSSILLYPEISLTQEVEALFRRRFGEDVSFLHSRLSPLDRYAIWKSLQEGKCRVVVGVRSAILSPIQRLGLIVLCEEENRSYKQEETPRYHARQIALMRSELEGATVLFESITPSLEVYNRAVLKKEYTLLRLSPPSSKKRPPKVTVVDMREEFHHQKRKVVLSKYLERRMAGVLQEKGKLLLFLNRRGFSTFIHCRRCGVVLRCATCDIPLKYHSEPMRLVCHYCNAKETPPTVCPSCRESYLQYGGVGTERIESEVHRLFPEAQIARMDRDTASSRRLRKELTETFRHGEGNVLIGTQMVTRETIPDGIPLVGILSADTLLNMPDFRSSERAYALFYRFIREVTRGGEGGEVVIQTFSPRHPVVLAALSHDPEDFYREELRSRKALGFPPFRSMAALLFQGKKEETVLSVSQAFKKRLLRLKKGKKISLIGPAPPFFGRVKRRAQWQLLLKSEKDILSDFLRVPLRRFQKSRSVRMIVDIDPY